MTAEPAYYITKITHEAAGLQVGYLGSYDRDGRTHEYFLDSRGRRVIAIMPSADAPAGHLWMQRPVFQAVLSVAMRATSQIKPPITFLVDELESVVAFSVRKRDRARVERKLEDIVNAHGKVQTT